MRLLLINYEYPPLGGGAGKATAALAREMVSLGHPVRVLTTRFSTYPDREVVDGYTVIRVSALRRWPDRSTPIEMVSFILAALPVALREAHTDRPDVCIAFFGIPSGPVAYVLKLLYGIPYLVSLRGGDVPGFQPYDLSFYHRLTRPLIRFIWQHSCGVVANSKGLRDLAHLAAPEIPISIIPNGVDIESCEPVDRSSSFSAPCILFVGRVVRQKGLDYLLDALALLDDKSYSLIIAGDGSQRSALTQRARRLGLQDRVTFSGWVPRDQIGELYRMADIFVLPSLDEGMPNVVLEAMAVGLPVVATAISGIEELIVTEDTGLLVPPKDPPALAKALQRLLQDRELRQRMGAAGLQRATLYSWHTAASQYLNLIRTSLHHTAAGM